jgi:shikimate dehydrogenase
MSVRKAFVAGWPVTHSRSPLIHRFWLSNYGIDGDYVAEASPPEAFPTFLREMRARGYLGGNVTLPHKEAAFRACDRSTPVAQRLAAANTLWLEGDVLCGDNTDVYGFAANLDERAPRWRNRTTALLLGAGGASRAVVQALLDAAFESVVLINRTSSRAEAVAEHFGSPVRAADLRELGGLLPHADLVVNATSAAIQGEADINIDWRVAPSGAIATDLTYVPLATPFLKGAAAEGLEIVDGLGMLLHQAVPGFERWFGIRPQVTPELRRLVEADLQS